MNKTLVTPDCDAVGARCPGCQAKAGALHVDGCDVERCAACGRQRISCDCAEMAEARLAWTGQWPGEAECREFGWWCRFVPGEGWIACGPDDADAGPDLNRLMSEGVWDAAAGRYRRRQ